MDKLLKREEVKVTDKWDIESVYKNLDDYNKDYNVVKDNIDKLRNIQNTFLNNSTSFKEFLLIDSKTSRLIAKLYTYAARKYDEDTGNATYQELYFKINNLYQSYGEATSFVVPMILEQDKDTIIGYLDKEHKNMGLSILGTEHFLTNLQNYLPLEKANKLYKRKGLNVYSLAYNRSRGYYITKYLYENCNIYLDRKFERYKEFCRLYEKSYKSLESKIGESCDANTEVNS